MAHRFEVQVDAAFRLRAQVAWVEFRVMVSGYVIERLVQHRYDVFKVVVRQVAAAQNQVNITKMPVWGKGIDAVHDLIAYGKDSHKHALCRRKRILASVLPDKIAIPGICISPKRTL